MKKTFFYIFLSLVAIGIISAFAIIIDGVRDNVQDADAIVILGNKVNTNGIPSKRLQTRLDRGLQLYNEGRAPRIIVSGGLGKEGYEEATVMKKYLVDRNVPESAVIEDREGYTTYDTAKNVAGMMSPFDSVIVVSQYYHISRTRLSFHKFGMEHVYSAHAYMTPEILDLYSIPREVVGYLVYWLR